MTVERLGVAGAGTMGAGIAQLSCMTGFETRLHDPVPEALAAAEARLREALAKGEQRGAWSGRDVERALGRLRFCPELQELAPCELVIEAAPERLQLKQELLRRLEDTCSELTVLATNTSSLPVTAIASALLNPQRAVGMHFFNPPARMRLVEIVAATQSSREALATATEVAQRMGRTTVRAADEPGFLGNRVARPFSLEALRLLGDGIAGHEQIDRVCRLGGGFRMGPFELMDLVGVDVNFEVAKSFYEQSFHEPRWQPHPIQARMVAAGRLGRKVGRGYYDYRHGPHRSEDPGQPAGGAGSTGVRSVAIEGQGSVARGLRAAARDAGLAVLTADHADEAEADVILDASAVGPRGGWTATSDRPVAASRRAGVPRAVLLAGGSLHALDREANAIGFHVLPPLAATTLVELTCGFATSDAAADAVESFFAALGMHREWVGDAPGLVLGRIVCQLVNEAAFALQKRVGTAADIDTAMRLGFNYPRGPLEWGEAIGLDHVVAVLDGLWSELREERYRCAPLLRRMFAESRRDARSTDAP